MSKKKEDVFQKNLKKIMEDSHKACNGQGAVVCIQLQGEGINVGMAGDMNMVSAMTATAMESDERIRAIISMAAYMHEAKNNGELDKFLETFKPNTEA